MKLSALFHKIPKATIKNGQQTAHIMVGEKGYEPAKIELAANIPTKLVFNRTNDSMCLARVQGEHPAFDVELPLNQDVVVTFTGLTPGTYQYHCGMNMFHGQLVVK
ncbi:cupredoxin domain-containing protein [Ligilactobacillus sp. LYQ139]|uniref:cupredoxin domain-containing protein n=1 Tax=Ligilactobacillus sp. LYQ139 TaxID=3378800 RepID=UPI0038527468